MLRYKFYSERLSKFKATLGFDNPRSLKYMWWNSEELSIKEMDLPKKNFGN